MSNPCPGRFQPRIRLMNLPRSPFSLKADLPVGFPYRFNSSFTCFLSCAQILVHCWEYFGGSWTRLYIWHTNMHQLSNYCIYNERKKRTHLIPRAGGGTGGWNFLEMIGAEYALSVLYCKIVVFCLITGQRTYKEKITTAIFFWLLSLVSTFKMIILLSYIIHVSWIP